VARLNVGDLYAGTEIGWAAGADPVYQPLAHALVAASPADLAGRLVLDVGAGTGAGTRALAAVGAVPIAVDLTFSMLAHDRVNRPPSAVADLYRLPIRPGSLGGAIAPFVLNHVDRPAAALAELAGVIEEGGVVLASTFSEHDRPAVKDQIDGVVARHGCVPAPEYSWFKSTAAPLTGDTGAMADVAAHAGLVDVEVVERAVEVGVSSPVELVAYRCSLPHIARFLAALDAARRDEIVAEAVAEVAAVHDGSDLAPVVVFLIARVA
jgi:SAM-dependent methyltransferase